jgi:hypothetical protein
MSAHKMRPAGSARPLPKSNIGPAAANDHRAGRSTGSARPRTKLERELAEGDIETRLPRARQGSARKA